MRYVFAAACLGSVAVSVHFALEARRHRVEAQAAYEEIVRQNATREQQQPAPWQAALRDVRAESVARDAVMYESLTWMIQKQCNVPVVPVVPLGEMPRRMPPDLEGEPVREEKKHSTVYLPSSAR